MADVAPLFARRAALLRELASLEESLGTALGDALRPAVVQDETLTAKDAAAFLGEPLETFRRRLDYRKALLRRPGERKLRYSRAELERVRQDRLAGNGGR